MSRAARVAIPMTVEEFRAWADCQPGKWELVDGEPRAMAPASLAHAFIQAEATFLIARHLRVRGSPCRVATEAPVVPSAFRRHNLRVPDVAVTCAPPEDDRGEMADPPCVIEVLSPSNEHATRANVWTYIPPCVIEVLSPSNEHATRANVWTYMTIPSVQEILLLESTGVGGELIVRRADGAWPEQAQALSATDEVRLASIGFACVLRDFYAQTGLPGSAA
jgi:Uma2 family endonuclease